MTCRIEAIRSRRGLRAFLLALVGVGTAGCSADVSRFNDLPFSNPFASRGIPAQSEVAPAVPARRVDSQPLPQTQAALPPPPRTNPADTGAIRPEAERRIAATGRDARTQIVTVGSGDTLHALSRRHGIPVAALIETNGLRSPNELKLGQRIVIPRSTAPTAPAARAPVQEARPEASPPPPVPAYGGFHIVGPGDTLAKIAERYRISVPELVAANGIAPQAQVKLGHRLVIPPPRAVASIGSAGTAAEAAPPKQATQAAALKAPAGAEPRATANLAVATESPAQVPKTEGGTLDFRWPARGRIITAFGTKPDGQSHDGIKLAVPQGTPVRASEDGEVAYAGNELKGYGNLILVRHRNGYVTAYAHASELLVRRGDQVKRGQIIAKSGQTGNVSSPLLHFEIRRGSTPVDPIRYLGT